MCGTFAILSPDLFTYVYSRIPAGGEREFIQKRDGGRRSVRCRGVGGRGAKRGGGKARAGKGGAWVGREVRGGFEGWMVLVTSRKQPKAAFAPFFKFFTTSFDAPPTDDCAVRVKGHVNDTAKRGNFRPFPASVDPLPRGRYLSLQSHGMYRAAAARVSDRRLSNRPRSLLFRGLSRASALASWKRHRASRATAPK